MSFLDSIAGYVNQLKDQVPQAQSIQEKQAQTRAKNFDTFTNAVMNAINTVSKVPSMNKFSDGGGWQSTTMTPEEGFKTSEAMQQGPTVYDAKLPVEQAKKQTRENKKKDEEKKQRAAQLGEQFSNLPKLQGGDISLLQPQAENLVGQEPSLRDSELEPRFATEYELRNKYGLSGDQAKELAVQLDDPDEIRRLKYYGEEGHAEGDFDDRPYLLQEILGDDVYRSLGGNPVIPTDDALEDEMRAMSESQAYLLENPGSTMGGHKIGDKTMRELMSESGNEGKGYGKDVDEEGNAKSNYSVDDLEGMSDIELYNLANQDADFNKYMVDTYGAGYGQDNAFYDLYLDADNGDAKEAITRDIFLGNDDAYQIDPVLRAQMLQRVYNANPEIANMVEEGKDDDAVKAIMDVYGFDNPLDMAQWATNEEYQATNPLTYDAQAVLTGRDIGTMTNGYNGALDAVNLDPADLALYAALGNMDYRGNAFDDRYNGYMSGYDRDDLVRLLGIAGYGDEFKKINFNKDDTDGRGAYTYQDWKNPNRNWSMAELNNMVANSSSPEELAEMLGVAYDPTTNNAVLSDAADRIFSEAWKNNYKYGARTPKASSQQQEG